MPRYRLTVAYDGSAFHGWQRQFVDARASPALVERLRRAASAPEPRPGTEGLVRPMPDTQPDVPAGSVELRTVQGELQRAVRLAVREPVTLTGSSRTDAGVHARGQAAAFTCSGDDPPSPHDLPTPQARPDLAQPTDDGSAAAEPGEGGLQASAPRGLGWPPSRGVQALCRAINARLPEDVLVLGASVVALDFDPIRGAERKAYSYTIHAGRDRPLFDRTRVAHVWHDLDPALMHEAAARLVGEHDFAAFAAAGHGRQTTVRTVFRFDVIEQPPDELTGARRLRLEVEGSGFLYNQVRIMAGTVAEAGRGRLSLSRIDEALRTGDRRLAGPTMPATGLCLEWIRFADRAPGGCLDAPQPA